MSGLHVVTMPSAVPPQHPGREGEGQHSPTHLRTCQGKEEEALVFAQQIASGMVGVVYCVM